MGKKIETRKDEIRFTTSDIKKMLNMYLAEPAIQEWQEDFIDEDTGKNFTINRSQVLFDAGILITPDVQTKINFYLQTGDLKEVTVSNQNRKAFKESAYIAPWNITIKVGDRRKHYLAYADEISSVLEIVNDFVELNETTSFRILSAKEMDYCIILGNSTIKTIYDEDGLTEKKFYQMEVKQIDEDAGFVNQQNYIVHACNTEHAILLIQCFNEQHQQLMMKDDPGYIAKKYRYIIEKAAPMPVAKFIPMGFTKAYMEG